jgi:hypothetical protein
MRGNASKFASKQLSVTEAKAQMLQLLCGCTDQRLAALTVDGLMASFRVDRKTAEYHLTIARQNRSHRETTNV